MKIEIVEATMKMQTIDVTVPGSPEQIDTHCAADGTDCKTTVRAATPPTPGKRPLFQFFAKAILPDGLHVSLLCVSPGDKDCAGIAPMGLKENDPNCETTANTTTCIVRNLGTYQAKRDNNDLVIFGPKGKLKYHISGSW